jgi:hypothetical protein
VKCTCGCGDVFNAGIATGRRPWHAPEGMRYASPPRWRRSTRPASDRRPGSRTSIRSSTHEFDPDPHARDPGERSVTHAQFLNPTEEEKDNDLHEQIGAACSAAGQRRLRRRIRRRRECAGHHVHPLCKTRPRKRS